MDSMTLMYLNTILTMLPDLTDEEIGTMQTAITVANAYLSQYGQDSPGVTTTRNTFGGGEIDLERTTKFVNALERLRLIRPAIVKMIGGGQ